ncbi:MAG: hypothetical protein OJF47_001217 [Nitrospira sp.]|jgi:hypothetical protein|nr:MAG: hypothetical protein OJF47_001217 [Nitrospira sp.]
MRQEMMEDEYSREMADSKAQEANRPRALTYDEKKAAEAAFRGEPFNPAWSAAAAMVYGGIVSAMEKRHTTEPVESDVTVECAIG